MHPKYTSILVTGIVRNVERRIEKEVKRIQSGLSGHFALINFFVIESDSTDKTLKKLSDLKSTNTNFDYLTFGKLNSDMPGRIERLRFCRNMYVKHIRTIPEPLKPKFILVVDFDIRNDALDFNQLFTFVNQTKIDWSAIFCNQTGRYFDIYALRAMGWSEQDCFEDAKNLSGVYGWKVAREKAIWSKMIKINQKTKNPIKVNSAFGGMGLYKTEIFENYDYTLCPGVLQSESEHIALHRKIELSGGNMFILPGFTNFSWNPHNLASFKVIRFLDTLTKRLKLINVRKILRNLFS